jgi:hypothetical protein
VRSQGRTSGANFGAVRPRLRQRLYCLPAPPGMDPGGAPRAWPPGRLARPTSPCGDMPQLAHRTTTNSCHRVV